MIDAEELKTLYGDPDEAPPKGTLKASSATFSDKAKTVKEPTVTVRFWPLGARGETKKPKTKRAKARARRVQALRAEKASRRPTPDPDGLTNHERNVLNRAWAKARIGG